MGQDIKRINNVTTLSNSSSCRSTGMAAATLAQIQPPSPKYQQQQQDQHQETSSQDEDKEQEQHQEQEQQQVDSTLDLPDECLGLIFDRLDNAARNAASLVCRRWLHAESAARRSLTLSAPSTLPTPSLTSTLARFSSLQKLALKCSRGVRSVSDDALHTVASHCPNLTKLKLKNCTALSDPGLAGFAAAAPPTLRSFSACSCGFAAEGLNSLISSCPNLQDLSLKKLRLADGTISAPSSTALRRLSIKHIADSGRAFLPLIVASRRLHTLILFKVMGKWDQLLEIAVAEDPDGLRDLVELRMERIAVGDRGLEAVAARCRRLQVLFLTRTPECSNAGVAAVAAGCRSLRKLHLDGCFSGRIGDRGLLSVAEKCPELKELVLIGLSATSESLNVLFSNCTGLERLALWNSETFGDRELNSIASRCRALRKLCIKCCPISDKGLEALVVGCPSLSKVKIKKCRGVSMAGTSSLMEAHGGLVITLESDLPPCIVVADDQMQQQHEPQQMQQAVSADVNGGRPSSVGRSPFSRARSAILAALGRVLS